MAGTAATKQGLHVEVVDAMIQRRRYAAILNSAREIPNAHHLFAIVSGRELPRRVGALGSLSLTGSTLVHFGFHLQTTLCNRTRVNTPSAKADGFGNHWRWVSCG